MPDTMNQTKTSKEGSLEAPTRHPVEFLIETTIDVKNRCRGGASVFSYATLGGEEAPFQGIK